MTRQIDNRGGLVLTAVCGGTASVPTNVVRATTTVDNSLLHATSVEASAAVNGTPITHHLPKNDFLIAGVAQDIVSTGHLQGTAPTRRRPGR